MTEVNVSALDEWEGYDLSGQAPESDHPFRVGMRVVWLSSLEWSDGYEYGTIKAIHDVAFTQLREIHTFARIEWDNETESREAVKATGWREMDIAPADTFTPNQEG